MDQKNKMVLVYVVKGPLRGNKYIIKTDSSLLIGRHPKATVQLESDTYISNKHAILGWEGGRCYIEDLNSTNGTFLNGKLIKKTYIENEVFITAGDTTLKIVVRNINDAKKR